jgi:hypothetical protein
VDSVTQPMQGTGRDTVDGTALDEALAGAVVSGEGSGPVLAGAVGTAEALEGALSIPHGAQDTRRPLGLPP